MPRRRMRIRRHLPSSFLPNVVPSFDMNAEVRLAFVERKLILYRRERRRHAARFDVGWNQERAMKLGREETQR
jgi:hypothetical protein